MGNTHGIIKIQSRGDEMNAKQRYDKTKTKMITFKVIKNTESDIIAKLDSVPNRASYIKTLIRADIERDKNLGGN